MNHAIYYLSLISILFAQSLVAQSNDNDILLSGVVLAGDSLRVIPNTNIIIKNKHKGTASNDQGYFSFYSEANDTLIFSAIGYKDGIYVVPDDLNKSHYSIVQIMSNDTIWLQETIIFPWSDYEDFGEELLSMKPPMDDEERAKFNLDNAQLYEKSVNLYMDGSANFKQQAKLQADRMYFAAQAPPLQIFNPFAWATFVKQIKNGDYKKKD